MLKRIPLPFAQKKRPEQSDVVLQSDASKQSSNGHILAKRTRLQVHARVSKTVKPAYENQAKRYYIMTIRPTFTP